MDLTTRLVPILCASPEVDFNIFDVLHHGTHEKQLSNLFAWLLDAHGSHNLGARFVQIFIDAVNRRRRDGTPLPSEEYAVRQEVNTAEVGAAGDVADLVLKSREAVIVVENFLTSDGHGHSYEAYRNYGQRDGLRGEVVLLCQQHAVESQTGGWENATVVTYREVVDRLHQELTSDLEYQVKHRDRFDFIQHVHRKFGTRGQLMEDQNTLEFIAAMCTSGQAIRYQDKAQEQAAEQFAADLAKQAKERFGEGRKALQRVKSELKTFCGSQLKTQLNAARGDGFVSKVSATYAGIYQWTINFDVADGTNPISAAGLQIKFGPSAWYANERDDAWKGKLVGLAADYGRLFLTRASTREVRQSAVTLHEAFAGISPGDLRLRDEILSMFADGR